MGGPPIIRLEQVSKAFGATRAVDAVSLDIAEGEFFALLGPSGCGKTTLLRLLAGLEVPDGGRIVIDGADMTGVAPNRRPVNMVFQSYAIFPHMSVAENVAFGLRVERTPAPERRRRVEEALALVKLEGFGGRSPGQLSGGQRQRVALARGLIKRPRVLLLDEPLSALDAKLREAMRGELAQLQAQVGVTFVFVTHDQDEALAMASRCAVMRSGGLEQVAAPAELYEAPASRFVAEFIGRVNLFAAVVQSWSAGMATLSAPDLSGPLQLATSAAKPGAAVWLALRPEKATIARLTTGPNPSTGECTVTGTVRQVVYLGSQSVLEVELASGHRIRAVRANLSAEPAERIAVGEAVQLSWPAQAMTLLTT